ncbi:hypothetical protein ADL03_25145 [Nocardia sp. NRRL S-836]|nr:hypothetical protein ADL03_25145 [Nocardia sp. NRRL S-836]
MATTGAAAGVWAALGGGVAALGDVVDVDDGGGSAGTAALHAVRASAHATRIGLSMRRTLDTPNG